MLINPRAFPIFGVAEDKEVGTMIDELCQKAEVRASSQKSGDSIFPGGSRSLGFGEGDLRFDGFMVVPGCIVCRDSRGAMHHTRICDIIANFPGQAPDKTMDRCGHQDAE
jgi:hypothetical protein